MTKSTLSVLFTALLALFAVSALAHPAADTAAVDTAAIDTAAIDTVAIDTVAVDTVAIETAATADALLEVVQEAVRGTADLEIEQALGLSHLEIELTSGGYSYPACFQVHGTPCQPGTYARCQWNPYEPEVCSCTNGTFQCGNLP